MSGKSVSSLAMIGIGLGWLAITGVTLVIAIAVSDSIYSPGQETWLAPAGAGLGFLMGFEWSRRQMRKARNRQR